MNNVEQAGFLACIVRPRKTPWLIPALLGAIYAVYSCPFVVSGLLDGGGHKAGGTSILNLLLIAPTEETVFVLLPVSAWLFYERRKQKLPNSSSVFKSTCWLSVIASLGFGAAHVWHEETDATPHWWWVWRVVQIGPFFSLMSLQMRAYMAAVIPVPFIPGTTPPWLLIQAFACTVLMHSTFNLMLNVLVGVWRSFHG